MQRSLRVRNGFRFIRKVKRGWDTDIFSWYSLIHTRVRVHGDGNLLVWILKRACWKSSFWMEFKDNLILENVSRNVSPLSFFTELGKELLRLLLLYICWWQFKKQYNGYYSLKLYLVRCSKFIFGKLIIIILVIVWYSKSYNLCVIIFILVYH